MALCFAACQELCKCRGGSRFDCQECLLPSVAKIVAVWGEGTIIIGDRHV